jgi:hypothetical protein
MDSGIPVRDRNRKAGAQVTADRSRDTSNALSEMRTVRSRAIAAIEALAKDGGEIEAIHHPASMDEDGYLDPYTEYVKDPDADEMLVLLTEFVAKTERFAKAGGHRTAAQRRRI